MQVYRAVFPGEGRSNNILSQFFQPFLVPWINGWPTIDIKKIVRIGGQSVVPVDVRIICATNKDLLKEVERGNFRQDLYYRLNVFSVILPPLRNRREDIPLFLDYLLERWTVKDGVPRKQVDPEVVRYLQQYHWPGNIRELQNVLERMVGLCS